ncbi:hypothetical protein FD27_GL001578 [Limosilactobacillus frumenti DSM 13145]|uniref:CvpA family protein n=1 Tax=Limosilactobacillus frumenti DSM 13145 TaxID=1423746 RepID=A0A0R1PDA9_9LACO|nr:CvpA family protein [Limosilactobacillus frumenti]KRL28580.1 hypothetical protein FD27_GL001578 [Limosilactobacillus frumenti DSM 13145]MBA2914508.1 CvpA family protein [Limosilactobacillus frumenti]QFG72350.1 CvpA family protein [Limosilactobacillus frumenti]
MILTTIIILLLLASFGLGHQRGIFTMVASVAVYIIAWVGAQMISPLVGNWLVNIFPQANGTTPLSGDQLAHLDLNQFFYHGLAQLVIFIVLIIVLHIILRKLGWIKHLPILGTIDRLAGGIVAVICCYLVIVVVLLIGQLWPNGWWQVQLANSELAQWMVSQTPVISEQMIDLFR